MIKLNELFDNIFNKYYKDVFRSTYSYTLNKSDSEDITQKVFTKLYENINKFKSDDDNVKKSIFEEISKMENQKRELETLIKDEESNIFQIEEKEIKHVLSTDGTYSKISGKNIGLPDYSVTILK